VAHWFSHDGPPERMQFDSAKPHLSGAVQEICRAFDVLARPIPAEAHHQQGRVESRISFFKELFARTSTATKITQEDNPWVWCAKICHGINSHIRKNGFSPYQFVFGREPRIPTSLLNWSQNLAAQAAAMTNPSSARAEEIRAAAARAMVEYDTDGSIRQAAGQRM